MEYHQRNPSVSDFLNEKLQARKMLNQLDNSVEEGEHQAYFKEK